MVRVKEVLLEHFFDTMGGLERLTVEFNHDAHVVYGFARQVIWQDPVRAATTKPLPPCLYTGARIVANSHGGLPTIDGVRLAVNSHVLVKDEIEPNRHGIYVVDNPGGVNFPFVLVRRDNGAQDLGFSVMVDDGVQNSGTGWIYSTGFDWLEHLTNGRWRWADGRQASAPSWTKFVETPSIKFVRS